MNEQLLLELKEYINVNYKPIITIRENEIRYFSMAGLLPEIKQKSNQVESRKELKKSLLRYKKDVPAKAVRLEEPEAKLNEIECFNKCMAEDNEDLETYIRKTQSKETFSNKLIQYINETGLPNADIYKRAGIDRRHFSKIICEKNYKPKKDTAVALCLALKLNLEQANELLNLAGLSFTNSETSDLVYKFCFERGIYDLMDVNIALDYLGLKTIGVAE